MEPVGAPPATAPSAAAGGPASAPPEKPAFMIALETAMAEAAARREAARLKPKKVDWSAVPADNLPAARKAWVADLQEKSAYVKAGIPKLRFVQGWFTEMWRLGVLPLPSHVPPGWQPKAPPPAAPAATDGKPPSAA